MSETGVPSQLSRCPRCGGAFEPRVVGEWSAPDLGHWDAAGGGPAYQGRCESCGVEWRAFGMAGDAAHALTWEATDTSAATPLPQPTPEEFEGMMDRSLSEGYAGWTELQRAIYLTVFRSGATPQSDVARRLGFSDAVVARALDDGMFGYLLWERANPDPVVNFK